MLQIALLLLLVEGYQKSGSRCYRCGIGLLFAEVGGIVFEPEPATIALRAMLNRGAPNEPRWGSWKVRSGIAPGGDRQVAKQRFAKYAVCVDNSEY